MGSRGRELSYITYTRSTEGLLKAAELFFGVGTWGIYWYSSNRNPVHYQFMVASGPLSFFLWVAFGSWSLTVVTYLFGLLERRSTLSSNNNVTKQDSPNICDLQMNVAIAIIYFPGIIVFGVYSFQYQDVIPKSSSINILVLASITFLFHLIHALSIIKCIKLGKKAWEQKREWIWTSLCRNTIDKAPPTQYSRSHEQRELPKRTQSLSPIRLGNDDKIEVKRWLRVQDPHVGDRLSLKSERVQEDNSSKTNTKEDYAIYEDVPDDSVMNTLHLSSQTYSNFMPDKQGINDLDQGLADISEHESTYLNPVITLSPAIMDAYNAVSKDNSNTGDNFGITVT